MGYEQVGGYVKFLKPKEFETGETMVEDGVWLGVFQNKYGDFHKFRLPDGSFVGLRGGHLDHLLKDVKVRTKVRIMYQGSFTLEDGPFKGNECHRFEVFQAVKDEEIDEASNPNVPSYDF